MHVGFDCYWSVSIKENERQQRASQGGLQSVISNRNQNCPYQLPKVSRVNENKSNLTNFCQCNPQFEHNAGLDCTEALQS